MHLSGRGESPRKSLLLVGNTGHSVSYTPNAEWMKVLSEGMLAKDEFRD